MLKFNKKSWYIIQIFSGFEENVVKHIHEYIKKYNLEDLFEKILIPKEKMIKKYIDYNHNKKNNFFSGYILIKMIMNNKSWHFLRSIPRVIGFIGGSVYNPLSISDKEIIFFINNFKKKINKKKPRISFKIGEIVRVNNGPFKNFNVVIEKIDYEKSRLKVKILLFGRSNSIELDLNQIEKD